MGVGSDIRAMLDGLEEHDAVDLSPVERLLMATDGTVTHMLEALTRDHVEVDILDRRVNGSWLKRKVVLRRDRDGSPLVWAESEVNLHPMEMEMEDELVSGDIGIGDLLRGRYEETRREVTSMGVAWEDTADLPGFIDDGSVLYLERTYKVYSGGDRLMTITEWFPKGLY